MSADSPEAQPTTPTVTPVSDSEKASRGMRVLMVVFALLLAFAAAVMIAVAVDIGDTPTLDECLQDASVVPADGTCFDGSESNKSMVIALSYASGGVGAIAVLLALAFVITGRRGRPVLLATGLAVLLGAIALVI